MDSGRPRWLLCPFFLSLLSLFLWAGCQKPSFYREARLIMGTIVELEIPLPQSAPLALASQAAFDAVHKVDETFSVYRPGSELSRINENAGREPVSVSSETYALLEEALEISRLTEGNFDITIGPLLKLWGFRKEKAWGPLPEPSRIERAKSLVGYRKIFLDPSNHSVSLREGVEIDLGGIAKGYAVDRAVETLQNAGIGNALISAGRGDLFCLGKPSPRRSWRIGLRHPFTPHQPIALLRLSDRAVSTSGVYEKFFSEKGKRWSHLIDPKTGYPVQSSLLSVTVVAPRCARSDALATALMISGEKKAKEWIARFDGIEAIFVEEKRGEVEVRFTEGLKDKIVVFPSHVSHGTVNR